MKNFTFFLFLLACLTFNVYDLVKIPKNSLKAYKKNEKYVDFVNGKMVMIDRIPPVVVVKTIYKQPDAPTTRVVVVVETVYMTQ